jgi:hypothetical protein
MVLCIFWKNKQNLNRFAQPNNPGTLASIYLATFSATTRKPMTFSSTQICAHGWQVNQEKTGV